jgi:flagellar protein FlgJ
MIRSIDPASLALQPQRLGELRYAAKQDPAGSMRAVAQNFESLFVNMMLKSMRSSSPGENNLFDSEHTRMYRDLMDQQLAQKIATTGKGLGLADMLLMQMKRSSAPPAQEKRPIPLHPTVEAAPLPLKREPTPLPLKAHLPGSDMIPLEQPGARAVRASQSNSQEFVAAVRPHAVAAAEELGVEPHALIAQAALESGWGKREIRLADGSPSYNLFGIKAGADWHGKVAETGTTEYVNGTAQKQVARFRAYDSYAEAFRDFAELLKNSPRYANALQTGDGKQFALALQQAGYATDPAYAAKLSRVMDSDVLRQALAA